ncbi:MAG: hypothetical protein DI549_10960 [Ancylobacter novellus]|uniref:Uncharacterized protein n=1 Tax=Ancylobacter novellus TaxID=921 RepID=A0A2W5R227_ANCNO|nr:MAG: hypothetical protein DI549_10960 [Ancylobacter novellus]
MKESRHPVLLSRSELDLVTLGLWHWEDLLRTSRITGKAQKDDVRVRDCEQQIARVRNLKARMFRAKPKAVQP